MLFNNIYPCILSTTLFCIFQIACGIDVNDHSHDTNYTLILLGGRTLPQSKNSSDLKKFLNSNLIRLIESKQCSHWNEVINTTPSLISTVSQDGVDNSNINSYLSNRKENNALETVNTNYADLFNVEYARNTPIKHKGDHMWFYGVKPAINIIANGHELFGGEYCLMMNASANSHLTNSISMAVSLDNVIKRPGVLLFTSFHVTFSLKEKKTVGVDNSDHGSDSGSDGYIEHEFDLNDILFVLRYGESIPETIHQYITTNIPPAILSTIDDGYNTLFDFIHKQVIREIPIGKQIKEKLRSIVHVYRMMCNNSINIGLGEKTVDIVDKYNQRVRHTCDLNNEIFTQYDEAHRVEGGVDAFENTIQDITIQWHAHHCCENWIYIDLHSIDITDMAQFDTIFNENNLERGINQDSNLVAHIKLEHVLEHLSVPEAIVSLLNIKQLVLKGRMKNKEVSESQMSVLRIAVPDINWSVPPNDMGERTGEGLTGDSFVSIDNDQSPTVLSNQNPSCPTRYFSTPYIHGHGVGCRESIPDSWVSTYFGKDIHAHHCVQYTLDHLTSLLNSIGYVKLTVVEYTDDNGIYRSPRYGAYADSYLGDEDIGISSYCDAQHDQGYIQRSKCGNKGNTTRSIIVDAYL